MLKLGINIGESSASKYMVRGRKPPSQTWRTLLENHAQQLVAIDFFTVPPRYLLLDRDAIFGEEFQRQVTDMGIHEVLSAPRSPWQRVYVERVIGSLRRECLDHVIVFHELSLRRILASYFQYYHRSRTHLSLEKGSPVPRSIQSPEMGRVVALPQLGGLHHRYERRAA